MLVLTSRNRKLVGALGAVLTASSFAMVPILSSSAAAHHVETLHPGTGTALRSAVELQTALPPVTDPFARPLPQPVSKTVIRADVKQGAPQAARVKAIVLGREPLALVEDSVVHIVTTGDRLGTARVQAMGADWVLLTDGRRLEIDGDTR